jgi:hypothetical protein
MASSPGAGVEEADGSFFPRQEWRPPAPGELAILVQASDGPTPPQGLESNVCLFQLPRHLWSEWWKMLEQDAEALADGRLPDFEPFVIKICEFLAFRASQSPRARAATWS